MSQIVLKVKEAKICKVSLVVVQFAPGVGQAVETAGGCLPWGALAGLFSESRCS